MALQLPGLEKLEKSYIPKAVDTLTSAFSEDPCLKFMLNSEVYDDQKASFLHRYAINIGLRYGVAFVTSPEVEGISIWMPPKRTTITTWMFVRSGGLGLRSKVDSGIINRMKKYDEYTSTIHHRQAPFTHWYLFTIGVRQEHQGKGYSNHLMMPVIDYFDENCQSCYLETHNQRNVSCYEKYGFKIAEIGCLPGTQKTHWGMIRLPI